MYTITYTESTCGSLDDDFKIKTIVALTYEELCVMVRNIGEVFGWTLIHIEEAAQSIKRRKVTRREQRPKVSVQKEKRSYSQNR